MCFVLAVSSSEAKRAGTEIVADVVRVSETDPFILTQRITIIFNDFATDVLSTVISKPIIIAAVFWGGGGEERERVHN